jgi:hypothetical protein
MAYLDTKSWTTDRCQSRSRIGVGSWSAGRPRSTDDDDDPAAASSRSSPSVLQRLGLFWSNPPSSLMVVFGFFFFANTLCAFFGVSSPLRTTATRTTTAAPKTAPCALFLGRLHRSHDRDCRDGPTHDKTTATARISVVHHHHHPALPPTIIKKASQPFLLAERVHSSAV